MKVLAVLLCAASIQAQDSFKQLVAKANQGDLQSEIAVGDSYNFGRGTEINYRKAEEWYKSAAGQGSGYAAYQIGQEYQLGHREETRGLLQIPIYDPVRDMQMARLYMLQSAALGYGARHGMDGLVFRGRLPDGPQSRRHFIHHNRAASSTTGERWRQFRRWLGGWLSEWHCP